MRGINWIESRIAKSEQRKALQSVQVRHQRLELLWRQLLLEARHFGAAKQDDIGDAIIVRRDAVFHERMLEQAGKARAAEVALAVGIVTFGAAGIVNPPPGGLLWIEPEFCVRLARLGAAGV